MISATNMNIWVGARELLHDLNFTVNNGNRVALVGANGSGKTTLINTFKQSPEERKLNFGDSLEIAPLRMAWVEQEVYALDLPALDYVTLGDHEYAHWSGELEKALATNDNTLIAQANAKLDEIDAWSIRSRASIIMSGLGFAQDKLEQPVRELSGGWRIRLNLARALLVPSELLLLDEPTNHLDIDAIYWLEDYLKKYQGTIVFISHDQEFLDNIASHVLYIANGTIESYTGNYSKAIEERKLRLERQEQQYKQQQKHIQEVQRFITRFKAKATKATQASSRIKYLEKLERIDPVVTGSEFNFHFEDGGRLPTNIATLKNVTLGYESGKPVLEKVNLSIQPGQRLAFLGLNGAGKSTLIKALAGELDALDGKGEIILNPLAKLGYFNQYVVDKLDLNATPLELMHRLDPKLLEADSRKFLASFNFKGDKVFEKVEGFSGGEKSRLTLALLVYQKPNFLLLDEPTNHLDLEMRQALAKALLDFKGTFIVVSHERFLLSTIVDQFYLIHNGLVEEFPGGLDAYYDWVLQYKAEQRSQLREEKASQANNKEETNKNSSQQKELTLADKEALLAKDTRLTKELKRLLLPQQQEINKLEKSLATLKEAIDKIHQQYLDHEIINDGNKVVELSAEEKKLNDQIEENEMLWLEIVEAMEITKEEFLNNNF